MKFVLVLLVLVYTVQASHSYDSGADDLYNLDNDDLNELINDRYNKYRRGVEDKKTEEKKKDEEKKKVIADRKDEEKKKDNAEKKDDKKNEAAKNTKPTTKTARKPRLRNVYGMDLENDNFTALLEKGLRVFNKICTELKNITDIPLNELGTKMMYQWLPWGAKFSKDVLKYFDTKLTQFIDTYDTFRH